MSGPFPEFTQISRRMFLRTTTLGALATASTPSQARHPGSVSEFEKPRPDLLNGSLQAANWIRSAERNSQQGRYWLPEPDHPEKTITISPVNGIYSGSAGIVLFFLQLGRATGNSSYFDDARRGGDFLAATWQDPAEKELVPGSSLSFYSGRSGVAFALAEVWKATGETKYKNASLAATDLIVQLAQNSPTGQFWSSSPGIIGDGSIVLYLLHAARVFQRDEYRALAGKAGEHILGLAEAQPSGGVRWKGASLVTLGISEETYFPNFELGTAGVAYVLARLYEETRDIRFLDAAKQGALHLQKIATMHGRGALIPYRYPDLTDIYYLGFCHGPAGTARLFYQLYKVTKEKSYLDWTESLARGVIDSGIPEKQTPGFWNVVCQCCGSAGLTDFFLGLWAATGNSEYYAFANRLANETLSRQTNFDGKGYRWYQAWTRVKPWDVAAETGYSIGAAGIGSALLHTSLAQNNKYQATVFPDNPFPDTYEGGVHAAAANVDFNDLDHFPP